jgi:hypothetical protein
MRRDISGKDPVTKLGDEFSVQPSKIYPWVKEVLDGVEPAFDQPAGRPPRVERVQAKLIERIQIKFVEKNEVVAELSSRALT